MTYPLRYIILLIGYYILSPIFASSHERVLMHVAQHIVYSGETIDYSTYYISSDSCCKTIIHYDLINHKGIRMLHWKTQYKAPYQCGSITIPDTIAVGHYVLRAYSGDMIDYPSEQMSLTPILIQTLYKETASTLETIALPRADIQDEALIIHHMENKNTFEVKTKDGIRDVKYSISIREISPIDTLLNAQKYDTNENANALTPYHTEQFGEVIKGKISTPNEEDKVDNKLIYMSYKDGSSHFEHTYTDLKGQFSFIVDSNYCGHDVYIQTACAELQNNYIWDIESKIPRDTSNLKTETIFLSDQQFSYLQNLKKRTLITRLYQEQQTLSEEKSKQCQHNNFYGKANMTILTADYVSLNNFQNICDNILPSVRFRNTSGAVELGMVINGKIVYNQSLILVDNIPCINTNYLKDLNSEQIVRIELVNQLVIHGELTFHGIISIFTNQTWDEEHFFDKTYYSFNHKWMTTPCDSTTINHTLPMTSPLIYWQPHISQSSETTRYLQYRKPDIKGTYQLQIKGIIDQTTPFSQSKIIHL